MTEESSESRAARIREWPLHAYRLGEEPGDDLSTTTTAEQRIEMVWQLSARMWELSGRPMPQYSRATMPIAIVALR
jgi:hypothetical protein